MGNIFSIFRRADADSGPNLKRSVSVQTSFKIVADLQNVENTRSLEVQPESVTLTSSLSSDLTRTPPLSSDLKPPESVPCQVPTSSRHPSCWVCSKRVKLRESRMWKSKRMCKGCYAKETVSTKPTVMTGQNSAERGNSPKASSSQNAPGNTGSTSTDDFQEEPATKKIRLSFPQSHGGHRRETVSMEPTVMIAENPAERGNSPKASSSQNSPGNTRSTATDDFQEESATKKIRLSFPQSFGGHRKCVICRSGRIGKGKISLVNVGRVARREMFLRRGIFVPEGAVCCKTHLGPSGHFTERAILSCQSAKSDAEFSPKDLEDLLSYLRSLANNNRLDFDTPGHLTSDDYHALTGITQKDFDHLFSHISGQVRNTHNRSPRRSLALLLMKLRTGLSYSVLAVLFGLRKSTVSRSIDSVRRLLMFSFVPTYLGVNHISREDFIKDHTSRVAKEIFSPDQEVAIVVLDGTYLYIQKSANYKFQRRSFSMHKGRNLLKPMMIVGTDGYILDVYGPFLADSKNNDASITTAIMKSFHSRFRLWLKQGDKFIVDRGFRDSLKILEDLGFETEMPRFTKGGAQYCTEDANSSRLVTKVRWVVEAANRLIKTWKFLDNVIPNTQILKAGDYLRIVCAICNAYRPPRISPSDEDVIEAQRMLRLSKLPNYLQQKVEARGWDKRRVVYQTVDDSAVLDFPHLTMEELRWMTMGVYQLKQSKSYTSEHLNSDGLYALSYVKESPDVIKVLIQSRHTTSKEYKLWIEYGATPLNPISGWYCKCQAGARVVGCCAHISSVMWYLGYWRHHPHSRDLSLNDEAVASVDDAAAYGWSDDDFTLSSTSSEDEVPSATQ